MNGGIFFIKSCLRCYSLERLLEGFLCHFIGWARCWCRACAALHVFTRLKSPLFKFCFDRKASFSAIHCFFLMANC